jgi:exopolyphosphatase/guanosine-5'-triphosphate,3'-diphosphate pyrophosphatase
LTKFKRLAESHGVDEIVAAGTSAVREAEDGGEFLDEVYGHTGIRVRVISGTEEARLIHLAAAYGVHVGSDTAVVVDIGGGSVEITMGTAAGPRLVRSFKLGVIRLTERFVKSDPLSPQHERRLARHVSREIRDHVTRLKAHGFDRVIGTSGTILSLGGLAAGARDTVDLRNRRVTVKQIRRLREQLVALDLRERVRLPGLDPKRADIAVAGIVLLDTILRRLGAEDIILCDLALREGLVLDYIRTNRARIAHAERYPDVRRRSVVELAQRFNCWTDHSQHIARLTLSLFDQTRSLHGLGDREREWIEFGALLHDAGLYISHARHHRHSHYLIKNGGLRGFAPDEVDVLALIARYHRRGTPKKSHDGFGDLPASMRRAVRLGAALVRLAEGLDRSHAQMIGSVQVADGKGELVVRLRPTGDAELEVWAAHRQVTPLAAVLGRPIRFEVIGTRHAKHAHHPSRVPGQVVRRRGHRRLGQDHAAGPAGQVAPGRRASGVPD